MKKIVLLIASILISIIGSEKTYAWCICADVDGLLTSGICFDTDWTPVMGTDHNWDSTYVLVTTYDYTGGCSYYGQPTPSNPTACDNSASISATQYYSWTFSGSMGSDAEGATFGVSGTHSTTYATAAKCGGPHPLNGFCQACSTTSYLTFHCKSQDAHCGCSDPITGVTCSDTQNGTLTTFTGLHCEALPAKPPQPCNPNCPPPA